MNKFLKVYPQLRDPQLGDTVEIITPFMSRYKIGHKCKLIRWDSDTWIGDFLKQGNDFVITHGVWSIGLYPKNFKVISHEQ